MASVIRVLHVDDEPDFADLAAEFLEREDDRLDVSTETRPADALARLGEERVDCVVSDYDMPEMDGLAFLDALRESHPDIPFVLFTGKGSEEVASDALSAGATDYLQKQGGTDQYAILANRVVNAVEQRESQTSYREIFEKAADAIFLHDPDTGALNDVNSRTVEMLGYDRETVLEMDVSAFSADDPRFSQTEAEKRIRKAMEEGPQTFEWRFAPKDGDEFWVEVHLKRTVINGQTQVLAMVRDVSERKERERQLAQSEQRYRTLAEHFPNGSVGMYDHDLRYTLVEGTAIGETLPSADELEGNRMPDIFPDEAVADLEPVFRTTVEDGTVGDTTTEFEGQHWRVWTAPLRDADGDVYAGMSFAQDVTGQVERQRRLQTQKEKVKALHDVAADIEACTTPDAVYDLLIEAGEDILDFDRGIVDGVEGDELVPKAVPDDISDDEYHEAVPVDAEDSLAAESYRTGESILVEDLGDHDVAPADPTYGSAITVPINDYGMFQAVARETAVFDETDLELMELLVKHARETLTRLERERDLRAYADELERQNERLEEFASVVSHDLRGPLNVASGRVEFAREDADSDHLDTASGALDRMDEIVERTLELAREGRSVGDTESVSLGRVAEQSWQVVGTENADLRVEDDVAVEADPERFQHLLENLFRNAVEHGSTNPRSQAHEDAVGTGSGEPSVTDVPEDAVEHSSAPDSRQSGSAVSNGGDGVTVRVGVLDGDEGIYVEDDGPGIPPGERDTVFDLGHTTAADGTGFGLAIVEEIVEAHRGEITVTDSEHAPDGASGENWTGGARFEITGLPTA